MIREDNEDLLVGKSGMIYLNHFKVLVDSRRTFKALYRRGLTKDWDFKTGEEVIISFPKELLKEVSKLIGVPGSVAEERKLYSRFVQTTPNKTEAKGCLLPIKQR